MGKGRHDKRCRLSPTRLLPSQQGFRRQASIPYDPAKPRHHKENSAVHSSGYRPQFIDDLPLRDYMQLDCGSGESHPRLRPHQGPSCRLGDPKPLHDVGSRGSGGSTRQVHHCGPVAQIGERSIEIEGLGNAEPFLFFPSPAQKARGLKAKIRLNEVDDR
jgi:hypothetical protein